jgi:hypothetical protein
MTAHQARFSAPQSCRSRQSAQRPIRRSPKVPQRGQARGTGSKGGYSEPSIMGRPVRGAWPGSVAAVRSLPLPALKRHRFLQPRHCAQPPGIAPQVLRDKAWARDDASVRRSSDSPTIIEPI